jgi:hypothetical protein
MHARSCIAPPTLFSIKCPLCFCRCLLSTWHMILGHILQGTVSQLSPRAVEFLTAHFQLRLHTLPPKPQLTKNLAAASKSRTSPGQISLNLLLEDTGVHSFFHNAPPASMPDMHPLAVSQVKELLVAGADTGFVSLESFLCIWAYCTFLDARKTVKAMVYLGFPDTYEYVPKLPVACLLVKVQCHTEQAGCLLPLFPQLCTEQARGITIHKGHLVWTLLHQRII